eukprot:scaffold417116_cov46-Prasinocladus_malaysianus.AAC.1
MESGPCSPLLSTVAVVMNSEKQRQITKAENTAHRRPSLRMATSSSIRSCSPASCQNEKSLHPFKLRRVQFLF